MVDALDGKVFDLVEGGDKLDLFTEDNTSKFEVFKELWETQDRTTYEDSKKENPGAGRYVGYLADNKELFKDVQDAANEVGVDPNFLYNVVMYEGMASQEGLPHGQEWKYNRDALKDTYADLGMDTFFAEKDTIESFLDSPIVNEGFTTSQENEAGDTWETGLLHSKDTWRGVAGMLKVREQELTNIFENRGFDFETLDSEDKEFWMYAAYNAGSGNAAKLLKSFGTTPMSNEKFNNPMENLKLRRGDEKLTEWMTNVDYVLGGTNITRAANPFNTNNPEAKYGYGQYLNLIDKYGRLKDNSDTGK